MFAIYPNICKQFESYIILAERVKEGMRDGAISTDAPQS